MLRVERLTTNTAAAFATLCPDYLLPLLTRLPARQGAVAVGVRIGARPVGLLLGRRHRRGLSFQIVHLAVDSGAENALSKMLAEAERYLLAMHFDAASMSFEVDHPGAAAIYSALEAQGWAIASTQVMFQRHQLHGDHPRWLQRAKRRRPSSTVRTIRDLGQDRLQRLHNASQADRFWEPGLGPCLDADPDASWAAVDGEAIVGWLMVVRRRRGLLYDRFFVRKSHRGRGFGGRLLVSALAAHHTREPNTAAYCYVVTPRPEALALYDRHLSPYVDQRVVSRIAVKSMVPNNSKKAPGV